MPQRLLHRLATFLSVLFRSGASAVSAEEVRWERYVKAGIAAHQQGDYKEAVRQTQFALKEAEDFGEEDPRVATTLHNLAEYFRLQDRYDEAESMHKRALTIRVNALGPVHPDVGESLHNLALVHKAQGRYDEAESTFERAIAIDEKALGREHLDVATDFDGLAGLYQAQGRYDEAEQMYERALSIKKKTLGPEHPQV